MIEKSDLQHEHLVFMNSTGITEEFINNFFDEQELQSNLMETWKLYHDRAIGLLLKVDYVKKDIWKKVSWHNIAIKYNFYNKNFVKMKKKEILNCIDTIEKFRYSINERMDKIMYFYNTGKILDD